MSSTPAAAPNFPLSPPVLTHLVSSVLGTLPRHPKASAEEIAVQRTAALHVIATLRPRDPIEAMLAARCAIANEAGVDSFRRASQPDLPVDALVRLRGKGISLWRLADDIMRELRFRQSRAPLQPAELPESVAVLRPAAAPAPEPEPAAPPAAEAAGNATPAPAASPAPSAEPAAPSAPPAIRPLAPAASKHLMQPEPAADPRVGGPPQTRASLYASASTAALLCDAARPPRAGQPAAASAARRAA